jgi:hypothetical protein
VQWLKEDENRDGAMKMRITTAAPATERLETGARDLDGATRNGARNLDGAT